jgi:hypothetical protein
MDNANNIPNTKLLNPILRRFITTLSTKLFSSSVPILIMMPYRRNLGGQASRSEPCRECVEVMYCTNQCDILLQLVSAGCSVISGINWALSSLLLLHCIFPLQFPPSLIYLPPESPQEAKLIPKFST